MTLKKSLVYLPLVASLLTCGATYGALDARLKAVEGKAEQSVSRAEVQVLTTALEDVKLEIRGLRSDLLNIYRDKR